MTPRSEVARAWRDAVMRHHQGLSILSGEPADECHHVLLAQHLRKRGGELNLPYEQLVYDARVGVPLTRDEHAAHHAWKQRVPRELLPACVAEFCEEYGLGWRLARDYPPAVCGRCGADAGDNWFDRSLCPCGEVMHTRCVQCGFAYGDCALEAAA